MTHEQTTQFDVSRILQLPAVGTTFAMIEVEIHDLAKFVEYVKGHLWTIGLYGGRIIAEMDAPAAIVGSTRASFALCMQWPDRAAFDAWWNSPEYERYKPLRDSAASVRVVVGSQRDPQVIIIGA